MEQNWSKCASEEFASGLAGELGMKHGKADGIFTDSANYVDLVPECSNLSIGYQSEHTAYETLDLEYLGKVIDRLIAVDWSKVPIVRKPGDDGRDSWRRYHWHASDAYEGYDEVVSDLFTFCDYCGQSFCHGYQTVDSYQVCRDCYDAELMYAERTKGKSV